MATATAVSLIFLLTTNFAGPPLLEMISFRFRFPMHRLTLPFVECSLLAIRTYRFPRPKPLLPLLSVWVRTEDTNKDSHWPGPLRPPLTHLVFPPPKYMSHYFEPDCFRFTPLRILLILPSLTVAVFQISPVVLPPILES